MKVIAFVGMPGSGKSIASEYFKNKEFYILYFGGLILEEVKRRGLEVNPRNEKTVREDLRRIHGMAACAYLSTPVIKEILSSQQNICIDGLYSFAEYKLLRDLLGDELAVVAIVCERKLRYSRLATREFRPLTALEAEQRDFSEIQNLEKGGPIAIADYSILNNSTEVEFINQLEQLKRRIFG